MNITIPNQTGDVNYSFSIVATTQTGTFSFGLKCSGLEQSNINFYGQSGLLKQGSGIIFSSYIQNEPFTISGFVGNGRSAFYKDGYLIDSVSTPKNQDINTIFFNKEGAGTYEFSYNINGEDNISSKNVLYISNDADKDAHFLGIVSGMGITGTGGGIRVQDGYVTGNFSGIDLIIFGYGNSGSQFASYKSNWGDLSQPIIYINSETTSQNGLNLISGSGTSGMPKTGYVVYPQNILFGRSDTQEDGGVALFKSTGNSFVHYSDFIPLISGQDQEDILSYTLPNTKLYLGSENQVGKRLIFGASESGDGYPHNNVTDEWRKIFIRSVYEGLVQEVPNSEFQTGYGIGVMRIGSTFIIR